MSPKNNFTDSSVADTKLYALNNGKNNYYNENSGQLSATSSAYASVINKMGNYTETSDGSSDQSQLYKGGYDESFSISEYDATLRPLNSRNNKNSLMGGSRYTNNKSNTKSKYGSRIYQDDDKQMGGMMSESEFTDTEQFDTRLFSLTGAQMGGHVNSESSAFIDTEQFESELIKTQSGGANSTFDANEFLDVILQMGGNNSESDDSKSDSNDTKSSNDSLFSSSHKPNSSKHSESSFNVTTTNNSQSGGRTNGSDSSSSSSDSSSDLSAPSDSTSSDSTNTSISDFDSKKYKLLKKLQHKKLLLSDEMIRNIGGASDTNDVYVIDSSSSAGSRHVNLRSSSNSSEKN